MDYQEGISSGVMKSVIAHLGQEGYEVIDDNTLIFGGPPVIRARRNEAGSTLSVSFGQGYPTCCGPPNDPLDWDSAIRTLRARKEFLSIMTGPAHHDPDTDNARTRERLQHAFNSSGQPKPDTEWIQRLLSTRKSFIESHPRGLLNDASAEVVVFLGSVDTHQNEINALSRQLGIPLIFIDSDMNVSSAGL